MVRSLLLTIFVVCDSKTKQIKSKIGQRYHLRGRELVENTVCTRPGRKLQKEVPLSPKIQPTSGRESVPVMWAKIMEEVEKIIGEGNYIGGHRAVLQGRSGMLSREKHVFFKVVQA